MRVAVIGGGIAGLSTAYFLAKMGAEVEVYEQKYLLYGASGRNSGGLTAQFADEDLIKLALRSLELYESIQSEVGFNFLLRRDGYIKIAGEKDAATLEEEVSYQRKKGLDVEILQPNEVKEYFQDINSNAFALASYYRDGGVVFPWPVIWGLAKGCRKLGTRIYDYSAVRVEVSGSEVLGVRVGDELRKFDCIVNAAGAWSKQISEQAGVEHENKIVKEEICVTESLKPYINPYILDISTGLHLSQSMRGEIVGGMVGREVEKINVKGSYDFLIRYARRVTELVPKLKGLSVLRQWAGVYDVGKDGKPVLGFTKVRGFVQANGFGRNGISLGLAAGEALAKLILKGKNREIEKFSPT